MALVSRHSRIGRPEMSSAWVIQLLLHIDEIRGACEGASLPRLERLGYRESWERFWAREPELKGCPEERDDGGVGQHDSDGDGVKPETRLHFGEGWDTLHLMEWNSPTAHMKFPHQACGGGDGDCNCVVSSYLCEFEEQVLTGEHAHGGGGDGWACYV